MEENIRKILVTWEYLNFLDMTHKAPSIIKRDELNFIKIKTFALWKWCLKKWEESYRLEKIFAYQIFNRLAACIYIKSSLNSTVRKQPNFKMGKGWNRHFTKKDIRLKTKHMKTFNIISHWKIKALTRYHYISIRNS